MYDFIYVLCWTTKFYVWRNMMILCWCALVMVMFESLFYFAHIFLLVVTVRGSSPYNVRNDYHWEGELFNKSVLIIEQPCFFCTMCILSSTTKKGEIESAIMPLILFWCWWQYTHRGLTKFVKYISGFSPLGIMCVWIMTSEIFIFLKNEETSLLA